MRLIQKHQQSYGKGKGKIEKSNADQLKEGWGKFFDDLLTGYELITEKLPNYLDNKLTNLRRYIQKNGPAKASDEEIKNWEAYENEQKRGLQLVMMPEEAMLLMGKLPATRATKLKEILNNTKRLEPEIKQWINWSNINNRYTPFGVGYKVDNWTQDFVGITDAPKAMANVGSFFERYYKRDPEVAMAWMRRLKDLKSKQSQLLQGATFKHPSYRNYTIDDYLQAIDRVLSNPTPRTYFTSKNSDPIMDMYSAIFETSPY